MAGGGHGGVEGGGPWGVLSGGPKGGSLGGGHRGELRGGSLRGGFGKVPKGALGGGVSGGGPKKGRGGHRGPLCCGVVPIGEGSQMGLGVMGDPDVVGGFLYGGGGGTVSGGVP